MVHISTLQLEWFNAKNRMYDCNSDIRLKILLFSKKECENLTQRQSPTCGFLLNLLFTPRTPY